MSEKTREVFAVVYDTETTGLPKDEFAVDSPRQAYPLQLAWIAVDQDLKPIHERSVIISPPEDIHLEPGAFRAHGKSLEYCWRVGVPFAEALAVFQEDCFRSEYRAGYNVSFDDTIMTNAFIRHDMAPGANRPAFLADNDSELDVAGMRKLALAPVFGNTLDFCVMKLAREKFRVPLGNGLFRNLTLSQSYRRITKRKMGDAHDALGDVRGTLTVWQELEETTPIPFDQARH